MAGRHGASSSRPPLGARLLPLRKGTHYWEDTNNTRASIAGFSAARRAFRRRCTSPTSATSSRRSAAGRSYVIAELDGAFTGYRELTVEAEYRKGQAWVQGSYTRSRYYGNFDQDGSTTADSNDANIFIGSSNIGDGAGRQLWDNKLGMLRGDRPNAFKIYGAYTLPWNASAGAFVIAQSGQPWEEHSYLPYAALTTNTSDTDRYAEPAGSHRVGRARAARLNYTQELPFLKRYKGVVTAYVFNVFDSQTGYNIQPNFAPPTSACHGPSSIRAGWS